MYCTGAAAIFTPRVVVEKRVTGHSLEIWFVMVF